MLAPMTMACSRRCKANPEFPFGFPNGTQYTPGRLWVDEVQLFRSWVPLAAPEIWKISARRDLRCWRSAAWSRG